MNNAHSPFTAIESAQILVEGLIQHGLAGAVVSPGSRNAPLLQALDNAGVPCKVALDERSAAHHALGMACALNAPVVVCCTSGTAALNHGPALAEAFKVGLPLISLTADRPPGAQDQWESQTLQQFGVHAPHVRADFQWLPELQHQNDAFFSDVDLALQSGPVHINCPFSEPLYPKGTAVAKSTTTWSARPGFDSKPSKAQIDVENHFATRVSDAIKNGQRILLLGGTQPQSLSIDTLKVWGQLSVITGDSTSGLGRSPSAIVATDRWMRGWALSHLAWDTIKPDVVVSFGAPLLSKSMRQALRNAPFEHLHIDVSGQAPSAFGSAAECLATTVPRALNAVALHVSASQIQAPPKTMAWQQLWTGLANQLEKAHPSALNAAPWSDLKAHAVLHRHAPENWTLHLGNSTPVRYAQLFHRPEIQTWSNRGVAGIDGCSSTAVGAAMAGQKVTLITGDLGFLYDANAFFVHPLPSHLRIAVIHNGGGGVFRWLDGPQRTGMLNTHFEMQHDTPLRSFCDLHGLEHERVTSEAALTQALKDWWMDAETPRVLEISTPSEESAEAYKAYMAAVSA